MADDKKQKALEKAKAVRAKKLAEAGKTEATTTTSSKPGGKATSTPKNYYDVYNPKTIEAAKKAGYDLTFLEPDVKYEAEKQGYGIGHQHDFDPESGFYYDKSRSKAPGKKGLENYMKLHSDIIDNYVSDDGSKGADAWKRDHLADANKKDSSGRYARNDRAIKYLVENRNKQYKDATGEDLLDFTKENAYVPGVQLFNLPNISKTKTDGDGTTPGGTTPGGTTPTDGKPKVEEEKKGDFKRNPITKAVGDAYTPWWLQDIVKIAGAAADLGRIKRYQPWQAKPNVHLPEATFYDPTRELGANAEQANIQTQGLAAFTGPQALSARSSAIQGQALKNAADIMGRYNNLNVGLANQLNQERTQILNTAEQNQANLDTQLWDKYTVMNQQFDNAKAMARQNLRQSYIDAITNRAKTQALNTLYDNYAVNPATGGTLEVNPNFTPTPTKSSSTLGDQLKSIMDQGFTREEAMQILLGKGASSKDDSNTNDYPYQAYS